MQHWRKSRGKDDAVCFAIVILPVLCSSLATDVYQKWNGRLFEEMFKAFKEGRSTANPALSWYKGEIWFFDNYVIPLAKKLETCGVFGVSSDEFLNYAEENRKEWAQKGETIVAEMVAKMEPIEEL